MSVYQLNLSVYQLNLSVYQLNLSVFEAPIDLRIARAEHIGTQGTKNTSQRSLWITQKWGSTVCAMDCEKAFVKEQKPPSKGLDRASHTETQSPQRE
jgi:hypothetical protein